MSKRKATVAPSPILPFTDNKGLTDYALGVWHHLGPTKGMGIQKIITDLGHSIITEIKPDQHQAFYAAMEALKNG